MKLFKFTFPRKVCSRPVLVVPDGHIMANGEAIDIYIASVRATEFIVILNCTRPSNTNEHIFN